MSKTYTRLCQFLVPLVLSAGFLAAISDAAAPLIRQYYTDERGTLRLYSRAVVTEGGRTVWLAGHATESEQVYPVTLQIEANDRPGVLAKLTELIAKRDSNIRTIDARRGDGGGASIEVVVEIKNQRQLTKLQEGILKLPDVLTVTRRRAGRQFSLAAGDSSDVSRH